jgi:hypothetical protein
VNRTQIQELFNLYQKQFGNLREVVIPPITFDPRLLRLLEKAIERGKKLTTEEVDREIPNISWKW